MTEASRQTLSALLDGECSSSETQRAIDEILADNALRQCWERYNLIGHVIGRQPVDRKLCRVAPRVLQSLAPEAFPHVTDRRKQPRYHQFLPVAVALAAGYLLVAVLVMPLGPSGGSAPGPGAPRALVAEASQGDGSAQKDLRLRAKLEQLVVSHHEHAAGPGLTGFVSYAAVVGRPGQP